MEGFTSRLKALYSWANALSGGALDILKDTLQRFSETRAAEAAAGMAYYTLFSLFPLVLALVAGGSYFLEREQVYRRVVEVVYEAFPVSHELIERNVQQVLNLRGTVGIVGLVGALWSASGMFTILTRNINRAWSWARPRNVLEMRLLALRMIGALALLLFGSLFSTAALNLLPRLQVPVGGDIAVYQTAVWKIVPRFVPRLFTLLLFLNLYRWTPNTEVRWSEALWGALAATLGWEAAARAFNWYLGSGWARYTLVYGSLGAVVVLMLWAYISSLITFFGAHLSATFTERRRRVKAKELLGKWGADLSKR